MEGSRVIVVGAGPGGVLSSLLLARKGYDVQVFEAKEKIGGRTTEIESGPYRFDTGPTFYMAPFVLEDILKIRVLISPNSGLFIA